MEWAIANEYGVWCSFCGELLSRDSEYVAGDNCPTCGALITGPGEMVAIPRLKFELERVDAYPTTLEGAIQHNALWDARALKHLFNHVDRHG